MKKTYIFKHKLVEGFTINIESSKQQYAFNILIMSVTEGRDFELTNPD